MYYPDLRSFPSRRASDLQTYGYIQTLHIVDEEDLPANPADFVKKHINTPDSVNNVLSFPLESVPANPARTIPSAKELTHPSPARKTNLNIPWSEEKLPPQPYLVDAPVSSNPLPALFKDEQSPHPKRRPSYGKVADPVKDLPAERISINEIADAGDKDSTTGKTCVKKVMMREETRYEEVMTCDHSYDERCHTSYVTSFQPHQEEDCEEKFRKVCTISYEDQAVNEVVEECLTQNIKDCSQTGEDECRTVYDTVCETSQEVHEVVDDVVKCRTENVEMCKDVTNGFITENKCELWPQEKCDVTQETVKKYSPKVQCKKVGREICTAGCLIKEAEPVCNDKVKAVIISKPVEECDMEPQKVCKQVTKLVPELLPQEECVQVPKEVCAMSKINPKKIQVPFIQNWCYDPNNFRIAPEVTQPVQYDPVE